MRFRWLTDELPVRYVGKTWPSPFKGKVGRILALRCGPGLRNVLVEFEDGPRVTCPIGCLRNVKNKEE